MDLLSYELRTDAAFIVLDDDKVNVMSAAMLNEIGLALDRSEAAGVPVVLRSARDGIFSAGFDLKVFAANDAPRSLEMVRAGAELALRLLEYPWPTIGVLEGHAFPMGTFLLLACDYRIASRGGHRMGLNEVAIGIAPPGFAVELARSRVHPAWLSRTVTLGEMFEPDEAQTAGFLDRVVPPEDVDAAIGAALSAVGALHQPSHAVAKYRLRADTVTRMRAAIDAELTLEAYASRGPSAVVLP